MKSFSFWSQAVHTSSAVFSTHIIFKKKIAVAMSRRRVIKRIIDSKRYNLVVYTSVQCVTFLFFCSIVVVVEIDSAPARVVTYSVEVGVS